MKKIFTLLFGMALVTGAFAQSGKRHGGNQNNSSYQQGNGQYQGSRGNGGNSGYNNSNPGYGSQSGRYNSNQQHGYNGGDNSYRNHGRDREYSYNQRRRDRHGWDGFDGDNYRRNHQHRGHHRMWIW